MLNEGFSQYLLLRGLDPLNSGGKRTPDPLEHSYSKGGQEGIFTIKIFLAVRFGYQIPILKPERIYFPRVSLC